jgi:hypothetical protein
VIVIPNLSNPFKVDIDASGYVMGEVLMQGGRPVCYNYELFHGEILNYPTYDKELYALIQAFKNSKHYMMVKETIIHTYHQPLQYLVA